MNKYIIIGIILFALPIGISAQKSADDILIQIEKNNTTLLALRKKADAQKIGNKTGIYLQNPELEFNYLWGNPSSIGNRTDFNLRQSFDFPTAYGYKNKIADLKNEQAELEYRKQVKVISLQVRIICIDLIYNNGLKSEYSKRLIHAQSVANSFKSKFDAGETGILEYNKAQINLLNLTNKMDLIDVERNALLAELTRLNGGTTIDFTESDFSATIIPTNFEQWYTQAEQSNPLLNWLKQEIEISQKQVNLNQALSLPKFQAGYMSETIVGQQFRGISVGLSIPLWENKNMVKSARANTLALQAMETDSKLQFYNQLKNLHTKTIALQTNVLNYSSKLQQFNNSDLLKKALDKGEISLIDYMIELTLYYQNVDKLLELKRDFNHTIAEMNQFL